MMTKFKSMMKMARMFKNKLIKLGTPMKNYWINVRIKSLIILWSRYLRKEEMDASRINSSCTMFQTISNSKLQHQLVNLQVMVMMMTGSMADKCLS